jgi:hypothetical protein
VLALVLGICLLVLSTHFAQSLSQLHTKMAQLEAALAKSDAELGFLRVSYSKLATPEPMKLVKPAMMHVGSPRMMLVDKAKDERVTGALPRTPGIIAAQNLDNELGEMSKFELNNEMGEREFVDDSADLEKDELENRPDGKEGQASQSTEYLPSNIMRTRAPNDVWLRAATPAMLNATGPSPLGDPGAVLLNLTPPSSPARIESTCKKVDMVEPGSVRDLFVTTAREIDPTMLCIRQCSPPRSPSSPALNCIRSNESTVSGGKKSARRSKTPDTTDKQWASEDAVNFMQRTVERAHLAAAALEEARAAVFLAQKEAETEARGAEAALEQAKEEAEADAAAARAAVASAAAKLKAIEGLKSAEKAWMAGVPMNGVQKDEGQHQREQEQQHARTEQEQMEQELEEAAQPLPPGWVVCSDPQQKECYYHEASGVVQFQRPSGLTVATEERAAAPQSRHADTEVDRALFSVV